MGGGLGFGWRGVVIGKGIDLLVGVELGLCDVFGVDIERDVDIEGLFLMVIFILLHLSYSNNTLKININPISSKSSILEILS